MVVENGVTTQHPVSTQLPTLTSRPFRCLRHRPWMASCDDCRKAHSGPSTQGAQATTGAP